MAADLLYIHICIHLSNLLPYTGIHRWKLTEGEGEGEGEGERDGEGDGEGDGDGEGEGEGEGGGEGGGAACAA